MKKIILLIGILSLAAFPAKADQQDTIYVTTHDQITINTDMETGENYFTEWGKFPSPDKEIRRMKMQVTLGHPDTMAIAHWDYLDHIHLRRTGGKDGESRDLEIGRIITPYGSSFTEDWSYTWEVDVTDFSEVLRDSAEIEYLHTGWEPDKLGWELTVRFEIITGPPSARPISISEIYKGDFPYGDADDPVENYLTPVPVEFEDGADFGRIRIQHTGHGFGEPDGCSEFCSRWREVKFNDQVIDHRDLWKDCGDNPLYPQGGTWIYDRGHWCPGELQKPDVMDVNARPGKHTIDFDMMPYVDSIGEVDGREVVTAYFVQYGAPTHRYDVAMESVIVPSTNQRYNRQNPAAFNPVIRFRNLGGDTLRNLTIKFGTRGFEKKTYQWKGSLAFDDVAELELPGAIDFTNDTNVFEVKLEKPNGKNDLWKADNEMTSRFRAPKELPTEIVAEYKTNNAPEDNHLFLINEEKDTVYQRKPVETKADTVYSDTIRVEPGLYEFYLTDEAGNGLEFWAQPQQGYGYLRFLDVDGNILHHFVSDCGNGQFLAFEASEGAVRDTTVAQRAFFIYPRRTKDTLELDAFLEKESDMEVRFVSDGEPVETHHYTGFKKGTFEYSLQYLPQGRYVVEIYVEDKLVHKDRINRD